MPGIVPRFCFRCYPKNRFSSMFMGERVISSALLLILWQGRDSETIEEYISKLPHN